MARLQRVTLALVVSASLAASARSSAQSEVPELRCGDALALEIRAGDPVASGRGSARSVNLRAEVRGVLYLWTSASELDLALRVQDGGGALLGEDDDSGGGTVPCVSLEVEPGVELVVQVSAAAPGQTGALELHALCAPETPETLAMAEALLHAVEQAQATRDAAAARELLARAVDESLAIPGARDSTRVCRALWTLGFESDALQDLRTARSAWGAMNQLWERVLPDAHPERQAARMGVANVLAQLGELRDALVLQEKVLEVYERTLPPDDPELQKARLNLGATCGMLGNLPRARTLQARALEVLEATRPEEDPELVRARMSFALTLRGLGDLPAARVAFEHTVEVMSRTLSADDLDLQKARINLAGTLYVLGEYHEAAALYEEVVDTLTRTQADDHAALQLARQGLAVSLIALGDLPRASELQEKVVEVLSRTLPEGHPSLVLAQFNLTGIAQLAGDLTRAREMGEKVLEAQLRALPEDHADLQGARLGLAGTLKALGDLHGARALEEKVLEVFTRTLPPDHPSLLKARQNLALTMEQLGDLHGARALQESVLEAFARTQPDDQYDLQMARLNLATTLYRLEDRAGARALLEKLLAVSSLPDDNPDIQAARSNLAMILVDLGETEGALELQEKVVEALARAHPDDHPVVLAARANLAGLLLLSGDLARAREIGQGVYGLLASRLPEDHPDLQAVRRTLLAISLVSNDDEGVRRLAVEIERGVQALMAETRGVSSASELERRVAAAGAEISMLLWSSSQVEASSLGPELERRAFALAEATRSVALVDARLLQGFGSGADVERLRARQRSASEELVRRARAGEGRDRLQEARLALDQVEREISAQLDSSPAASAILAEPTVEALSRGLAPDEALIAFWQYSRWQLEQGSLGDTIGTRSLLAFVVRSEGRLTRVELGPMKAIAHAVEAWRSDLGASTDSRAQRGITQAGRTGSPRASGEALRHLLLDPLLPALEGTQRWIVALDDVLHLVPLDALPEGEGLVGERRRLEFRSSLRELFWPRERLDPDGALLVMGGAAFASAGRGAAIEAASPGEPQSPSRSLAPASAGSVDVLRGTAWELGFTDLPGSEREARGIADLYRAAFGEDATRFVLTGPEASRTSLEDLAPRARWLHLATHGWFALDSMASRARPGADAGTDAGPLEQPRAFGPGAGTGEQVSGGSPMVLCGLALAGANLGPDELGRNAGLVTAQELAGQGLSNCELAVLSACDTSIGAQSAGQGVASLQRALHIAGARTVIASLWKVDDEATRELMLDFYRRVWIEREPKARALWSAKMALRNEGHPARDWAGWMLTGESD